VRHPVNRRPSYFFDALGKARSEIATVRDARPDARNRRGLMAQSQTVPDKSRISVGSSLATQELSNGNLESNEFPVF
jgi:hypothetical protein